MSVEKISQLNIENVSDTDITKEEIDRTKSSILARIDKLKTKDTDRINELKKHINKYFDDLYETYTKEISKLKTQKHLLSQAVRASIASITGKTTDITGITKEKKMLGYELEGSGVITELEVSELKLDLLRKKQDLVDLQIKLAQSKANELRKKLLSRPKINKLVKPATYRSKENVKTWLKEAEEKFRFRDKIKNYGLDSSDIDKITEMIAMLDTNNLVRIKPLNTRDPHTILKGLWAEVDKTAIKDIINKNIKILDHSLGSSIEKVMDRFTDVFKNFKDKLDKNKLKDIKSYIRRFGESIGLTLINTDNSINTNNLFVYITSTPPETIKQEIDIFLQIQRHKQNETFFMTKKSNINSEYISLDKQTKTLKIKDIDEKQSKRKLLIENDKEMLVQLGSKLKILKAQQKINIGIDQTQNKEEIKKVESSILVIKNRLKLNNERTESMELDSQIIKSDIITSKNKLNLKEQYKWEYYLEKMDNNLISISALKITKRNPVGSFIKDIKKEIKKQHPNAQTEFIDRYSEYILKKNNHLLPMLKLHSKIDGSKFGLVNGLLSVTPKDIPPKNISKSIKENAFFGGFFGKIIKFLTRFLKGFTKNRNHPLSKIFKGMLGDLDNNNPKEADNKAFKLMNTPALKKEYIGIFKNLKYNNIQFGFAGDLSFLMRYSNEATKNNQTPIEYFKNILNKDSVKEVLGYINTNTHLKDIQIDLRDIHFFSKNKSGKPILEQLQHINNKSVFKDRINLLRLGANYKKEKIEVYDNVLHTLNFDQIQKLADLKISNIKSNWGLLQTIIPNKTPEEFINHCTISETNVLTEIIDKSAQIYGRKFIDNNFKNLNNTQHLENLDLKLKEKIFCSARKYLQTFSQYLSDISKLDISNGRITANITTPAPFSLVITKPGENPVFKIFIKDKSFQSLNLFTVLNKINSLNKPKTTK